VLRHVSCFNPHPSRRTGATAWGDRKQPRGPRFQSSPVPKDGCNVTLTRYLTQEKVSILTRPEGRVQLTQLVHHGDEKTFQSSPVPKDGCNDAAGYAVLGADEFQSSPVPKDGCNRRVSVSVR